jgi:hypothetical protein
MDRIEKITTESGLREALARGELTLPPLEVLSFEAEVRKESAGRVSVLDGVLTLRWAERTFKFGVEFKRFGTPKAIEEAVFQARERCRPWGLLPLVVVPFLSGERLAVLEAEGVSGLDFCGNGVVIVPGELLVYRTGKPNRFPAEGAIKNVYRRSSSIVARAFLLAPRYESVRALLAEIRKRGGEVTIATVSKVCTALDEEIVIERAREESKGREKQLRLVQPEKLLDLLTSNYATPTVTRRTAGKCALPYPDLVRALQAWAEGSGNRVVETGASSALAYSTMVREPMRSFYCTDLDGLRKALGEQLRETDRFSNVEFLETNDEFVYFDRREGLAASPVQTYLELMAGDKRERETAEQVRRLILEPLRPLSEGR